MQASARASRGRTGRPTAGHFPREGVAALVRRLPAYARLAWLLGRDPRLSRRRRLSVLAAAAYLISPVDLIPGLIPLVGQLDDLVVVLATLRSALSGLPEEVRRAHLASAGLSERTIDEDVGTLIDTAAWAVATGARIAAAGARAGLHLAGVGLRRIGGRAHRLPRGAR